MASNQAAWTEEHTNFNRLMRIVLELLRDLLWQILTSKIQEKDIQQTICRNIGKIKLSSIRIQKICQPAGKILSNTDFDITSLYSILRNICPKLKPPTQGWVAEVEKNYPTNKDFNTADDIERIRMKRNSLFGHIEEARISTAEYNNEISEITAIVKRLDGSFGKKQNNFKFLNSLKSCSMSEEQEKELIDLLKQEKQFDEETREMVMNVEGKVDQLAVQVENNSKSTTVLEKGMKRMKKRVKNQKSKIEVMDDVQQQHSAKLEEQTGEIKACKQNIEHLKSETVDKGKLKVMDYVQQHSVRLIEQTVEIEACKRKIEHLESETVNKAPTAHGSNNITVHFDRCRDNLDNKPTIIVGEPLRENIKKTQTYASVTAKGLQTSPSKDDIKGKNVNVYTKNQVIIKLAGPGEKMSSDKNTPLIKMTENARNFLTATKDLNDGHYILVTGNVKRNKFLESLALIPWVAAFDFDPYSRSTGLLSVVEEKLASHDRSLHINCIEDHNLSNINEYSTHWMFCRGCRENSNSKESYSYKEWKLDEAINAGLKRFCKMLKDFANVYTKYTVIVLFPEDTSITDFVFRLMEKLEKYVKPSFVGIKACMDGTLTCIEQTICRQFRENLTSLSMDIKDMCEIVANYYSNSAGISNSGYELPTSDKLNRVDIDAKQIAWLDEDLTVLYGNKLFDTPSATHKTLEKECSNFFKGGTLPWYMWYEVDAGHVDVKRDLTDELSEKITNKYIKISRSGIITLHHAPGCGGTTLAQRVLWGLRRLTPCAQEKLRSNSTVEDLVSRLDFLYEKTGLPILIMADGEDSQRVKHLNMCPKKAVVIILFVCRYPYPMDKKRNNDSAFWLDSFVSTKESKLLALKFKQQCSDKEKKKNIDNLAEEVAKGNRKYIYEFGLAAYAHEYKGIENFVKGYLKLPSKHQNDGTSLDPWHRALCMLSAAWYYGHIGIACQFFAGIPNLERENDVLTLEDFPENLQSLIVKDETENRLNIIRISNFYVAKEILEQLLPWPESRPSKRIDSICLKNIKDLENFAVELIKHAEKMDRGQHDQTVVKILARIFIIRDRVFGQKKYRDIFTEKHKVSQIFKDLTIKPLYDEMFRVMTQLTRSFPKDPHFWAHLGRLYTLFKPSEERAAQENFKKALKLCETLTKGQDVEKMSYHMRISFSITHYMFANMYRRKIAYFTGWNSKQKSRQSTPSAEFNEKAEKLLQLTQVAREKYQESRKYDPDVYNKIYAIIHEIHVCLMYCDFLFKNGGFPDIIKFIQQNDSSVSRFAEECIYEIDELFLEFFVTVEPEDVEEIVREYQQWYHALFRNASLIHNKVLVRKGKIHANRVQIAVIKLRYGSESSDVYSSLEDIQFEKEMLEIIENYEQIFADVQDEECNVKPASLDQDYREWLFAIRSKLITEPYSIEKVLEAVDLWDSKLHTPMSKFYQFVLKSILGFGTEHTLGNTHKLIEAQKLKKVVKRYKPVFLKSKYPNEWLGRGQGIQQMMYATRFFGGRGHGRDKKFDSVQLQELALMKGTIKHPNSNPFAGYISLDLGEENNISVDVFFVPVNFKMNFKTFAQERVEFNIGFTFAEGYEAFNIKPLQKIVCAECKMDVEFTSRDKSVVCQCSHTNVINTAEPPQGRDVEEKSNST